MTLEWQYFIYTFIAMHILETVFYMYRTSTGTRHEERVYQENAQPEAFSIIKHHWLEITPEKVDVCLDI